MNGAHETLATVVVAELEIIQDVRNALHAHSRPDFDFPNHMRIECRGLLEGAIRRLDQAVENHTDEAAL